MPNLFLIAKRMTIIAVFVFCIAGITAVTERYQQARLNDGYDNAQLRYFLQVNESMSNEEKYQLIQEICNTSYPIELQHSLYVMPSCKKSIWKCECEQRLIKSN